MKDEQFSLGITILRWKKLGIKFKRLGFQFRPLLISRSKFEANRTDSALEINKRTNSMLNALHVFLYHNFNPMLILTSYRSVSLASNGAES